MAGKITVSTLNNDTGVLATQNGMTGIAKAWVQFSVSGTTTITINKSFNCSSITRNSTSLYTFNFATTMTDTGYVPVGSAAGNTTYNTGAVSPFQTPSTGVITNPTTSAFIFATYNTSGTNNVENPAFVNMAVFGN
jgi:hypothetical protein